MASSCRRLGSRLAWGSKKAATPDGGQMARYLRPQPETGRLPASDARKARRLCRTEMRLCNHPQQRARPLSCDGQTVSDTEPLHCWPETARPLPAARSGTLASRSCAQLETARSRRNSFSPAGPTRSAHLTLCPAVFPRRAGTFAFLILARGPKRHARCPQPETARWLGFALLRAARNGTLAAR